jgi:hypothetical protein
MLTRGIIVLHDNAHSHVAHTVQDMLYSMHWKVSDNPPYCLDLSPHDFNVFGPLKKALKGRRFRLHKDTKAVVVKRFLQQPMESFVEGIHWLVHQGDAFPNICGGYL